MTETDDTQGNDDTTEIELLQAQITVLEAENIKLKAEVAGLTAAKTELVTLISDSSTVQAVFNKAAIALSDEIAEMEANLTVMPDGLTAEEKKALTEQRQKKINEAKAKQETYKSYIRGDI